MTKRPRAVALVDGEHYPPVLLDALSAIAKDSDVVAAVMLGGGEKLRGSMTLGDLPVVEGPSHRAAMEAAIAAYRPDEVIELSDAPVLVARGRNLLAAVAARHGCVYRGAGFRFDPPFSLSRRPSVPSVSVVGTGKRTGKTAISAALARHAAARGIRPLIVAMGRGGPEKPVVTHGELARPTAETLLELAERGEHAASDTYEDAVVAGVTTVGARRAGSGVLGAPLFHTVEEALTVAEAEEPQLIILEGSGTALPPVRADGTVLVVGGSTSPDEMTTPLGYFRLLIADLVLVTMAEEPVLSTETLSALTSTITELARDVSVVGTVFRPAPVGSVSGKRIFFATTAPEVVGDPLRRHLEEAYGAVVVGITHKLADRAGLSQDLEDAEGTYEVLLTELKAAAVDVAARAALASGATVVFSDNLPIAVDGDLETAFDRIIATAMAQTEDR